MNTKTDTDGNRYIDMTPTWPEALRMYRMLIENGDAEGKATAWAELERMAEIAQAHTDAQKRAHDIVAKADPDKATPILGGDA